MAFTLASISYLAILVKYILAKKKLKGSASTCLPPLMDRCGKIISESNAKADLLNEVFINKNTSLAPDACVFGPSPLNVTFDLGTLIHRTFNVSYVH